MKNCNSCGKCCETVGNGGLSASSEEIDWWDTHRPDIARYAQDGRIWVNPDTGEYLDHCPWLKRSIDGTRTSCDIYHDRPQECRHYPIDIEQMVRHDCEMLERRDLVDIKRAQKNLDVLMTGSRPPVIR